MCPLAKCESSRAGDLAAVDLDFEVIVLSDDFQGEPVAGRDEGVANGDDRGSPLSFPPSSQTGCQFCRGDCRCRCAASYP